MAIEFTCPHCLCHYRLKDESAGKKKTCKHCGNVMDVPGGKSPRAPRALVVSPPIRDRLLTLQGCLTMPRKPELEANRVADVEDALGCVLPDEILAAIAVGINGLLGGEAFRLEHLADCQKQAEEAKFPHDLICLGIDNGKVFYGITRTGPRNKTPGITTYLVEDASTQYAPFSQWLDDLIERKRGDDDDSEDGATIVMSATEDVLGFQPRLV